MYDRLRNSKRNRIAASGVIAFIAIGSAASASTGGVTFNEKASAPSVAQLDSKGACPKVEKIKPKTTISARCQDFLHKTLRNSVYDSTDRAHAFAALQAVANLKSVDGIPGPETAKAILQGDAKRPAVPSKRFAKKAGVLIDKSDQVAYVMSKSKYTGKGKVDHILKVSTGTEEKYDEVVTLKDGSQKRVRGTADTPTGKFVIDRVEPSDYSADLGSMPYARFINHKDGIAIHSGTVAPNLQGLSHGCIRVPANDMVTMVVPVVGMGTLVTIR